MQYFPLFLDLNNKPVLVVGGGEVASRKIESLLRANAKVTIVSPVLTDYLQNCVEEGRLTWICSQYRESFITNYIQVWATTSDAELNHQIHKDAKKRNILVNVVDDKPYCDFITPSMINRGKVQIAISSGGGSPVLVRNIREKIERVLSHNTGLLAEFAATKRRDIKNVYKSVDERRRFWERFFADSKIELIDNIEELESLYQSHLFNEVGVTLSRCWIEFGRDVELISIKTLRIMQESERVFYPEGCPFSFIDLCRRDAERTCYQSHAHLVQLLKENSRVQTSRTCIFMPKGISKSNTLLKELIASDKVLRIVE
ncbi:precorrin-2 dehydrogenase/sirohydrochlorin ferrochelatase family protein [Vibrio sp. VB16]|uniref:precorrin-2 dehydrogenase/sirohydrochlorin ferrochelatase family protein n=1 Tax=Vibrio sp. VB16 TaxID=2785746 RepID=UPI00189F87F7|nr:bifunctional precorrin-2 dehydrogenase/sirohydrochlorin ferrochelatase [Vibrio sp. VB16]UGA56281.1 siroheme synthase [Vibrio sp. VB16]